MALTLTQLRDHVRDTVDLDSTELPDTYLGVLLTEGTHDIATRRRDWPSYEQQYTFNTVANQHDYALATIEPASTDTAEIISIVDGTAGGYRLQRVPHDFAENYYRNSLDHASTPLVWSLWAAEIYLWPKPADIRTMTVRAYRKTKDWVALGASEPPDLDERLHVAVGLYALIRVYEQQEEPTMAERYRQLYESYVDRTITEIFRDHQSMRVLAGGMRFPRWSEGAWMQSLIDNG